MADRESGGSGRRCVALDPGGRTGWAFWDGHRYETGNLEPDELWDFLNEMEDEWQPDWVYESFRLRPGLAHYELTPVELIGVIKEWARQNGVELHDQSSDKISTYYTDDKLRRAGLWKAGKAHKDEMSALKHLCFFRKDLLI